MYSSPYAKGTVSILIVILGITPALMYTTLMIINQAIKNDRLQTMYILLDIGSKKKDIQIVSVNEYYPNKFIYMYSPTSTRILCKLDKRSLLQINYNVYKGKGLLVDNKNLTIYFNNYHYKRTIYVKCKSYLPSRVYSCVKKEMLI